MPKRKLTDSWLQSAKPEPGKMQTRYFDTIERRLLCVVGAGGSRTFQAVHYIAGKPKMITLGRFPALALAAARKRASEFRDNPSAAIAKVESGTFEDEATNYIRRYVEPRGLRSRYEIERQLKAYINPKIGNVRVRDLRRSNITSILDQVEDEHGPRQADACLATIRSVLGFYASRSDDYVSPIVRGMQRQKPREHARDRILNDDEIRALWRATAEPGAFNAIVRLLLLTAQRREMVAGMKHDDVDDDGVWKLPEGERRKGNVGAVKLPAAALEIIRAQPQIDDISLLFPGSRQRRKGKGIGPFCAFTKPKTDLDKACGFSDWVLHDLRRTSRSLMSRAQVAPHIAERVLGHVQPGVLGVYDRHRYDEEKAAALQALADLLARIIDPPADNKVVTLAERRR